jgi:hypothetical protein
MVDYQAVGNDITKFCHLMIRIIITDSVNKFD